MNMSFSGLAGRLLLAYLGLGFLTTSVIQFSRLTDRLRGEDESARAHVSIESSHLRSILSAWRDGSIPQSLRDQIDNHRRLLDSTIFVHVCRGKNSPVYDSPHHAEGGPLCELSSNPLPFLTMIEQQSTPLLLSGNVEGEYRIYVARPVPTFLQLFVLSPPDFFILLPQVLAVLLVGGLFMGLAFLRLTRMYSRSIILSVEQSNKLSPLEMLKPPGPVWSVLFRPVFDVIQRMHLSRNQALSFASYASHELRTPLAVIRNQLENAMTEGLSGAKLRRTIGSTYDEVLRLRRSIDDLLSLATMQAGSFQLSRVRVHLNQFLKEFYDEALLLTRPRNISVVLKQGPPATVAIDLQRFRQLLFNLLDNALKHTDADGRIRMSFTVEKEMVNLTFSDTGRGISQEALPHIFQPFYRDPRTLNVSGSGLGLALVRWIVELHGGTIAVASDLGHGTTFTLRIPVEHTDQDL